MNVLKLYQKLSFCSLSPATVLKHNVNLLGHSLKAELFM